MPINKLIQIRRDTAADWLTANPTLEDGEFGYEEDTRKLKIGDGLLPWNTLPYFMGDVYPPDLSAYATIVQLNAHANNTNNPHGVTKSQVGLGNVPNTDFTAAVAANTAKNSYPSVDAAKLATIASGAQVNSVTSVAGKTGAVALNAADVGLGNVNNTSDANKPVSTAQQTALNTKQDTLVSATNIKTVNGVSLLGSGNLPVVGTPSPWGTIPGTLSDQTDLMAALAAKASQSNLNTHTSDTNNPHNVTKSQVNLGNADNTSDANKPISNATQIALNAKLSNITGLIDDGANITITGSGTLADPYVISSSGGGGGGAVSSVNGYIGAVVLAKADVGLGNADNTSDANKPVSTATQTALNLKAPLASPAFTGTPTGITKTHVGLGNVDNTSDANKPVSTAQAAADATKQAILVSGTNIKTVNGSSILGSGNLAIANGIDWTLVAMMGGL